MFIEMETFIVMFDSEGVARETVYQYPINI